MTALSAAQFPGAEQQPLAYPGLRPDFSYVYYKGMVHKINPRGDTYADLWLDDPSGQVTLDAFLEARRNATISQRHAVLAVGSNGCPGRLAEKYGDQPEVALPVFVGTLADTAVVYSRRLVSYGALPATYLHQPGAVSWLSVTMLTDEQLARMDETEKVGEIYQRIPVPGHFNIEGGPQISNLTAYLDREILTYKDKPVRLKVFAREGPNWPVMDEPEVLSRVFDQAGLLLGEPTEMRHRQLLTDEVLRQQVTKFLVTRMSARMVDEKGHLIERKTLKCIRILPTSDRPRSKGTYIARLSYADTRLLKVRNGAYLRVSHGKASVLARLSVERDLDNNAVRLDQTLRHAICLEKIMQGLGKKELVYNPDGGGTLEHPVAIQRSTFRGPTPLARFLKQQYLICVVHHATARDMETSIARLTAQAMDVIGIKSGDKVLLISEKKSKRLRCLSLDPGIELPMDSMRKYFTPPCPDSVYEDLPLPWITIDLQTRRDLRVDPWEPIIVGRDPRHVLAWELGGLASAIALSALGGAIVLPSWIITDYPWLPLGILGSGLVVLLVLLWFKIRSRI